MSEETGWLQTAVSTQQPQSVLLAGAQVQARVAPFLASGVVVHTLTSATSGGEAHPRVDLAVLDRDFLATLDTAGLSRLVAALRDLHAAAVVARADEACPLGAAEWRALGFSPHGRDEDGCHLYGFNLYDYKPRPDWLNARYWANPELWDRYRW